MQSLWLYLFAGNLQQEGNERVCVHSFFAPKQI